MDAKQFFVEVCKLRVLQKRLAKNGDRDTLTKNDLRRQEAIIDMEIKRVEAVLKDKAQPRFFEI